MNCLPPDAIQVRTLSRTAWTRPAAQLHALPVRVLPHIKRLDECFRTSLCASPAHAARPDTSSRKRSRGSPGGPRRSPRWRPASGAHSAARRSPKWSRWRDRGRAAGNEKRKRRPSAALSAGTGCFRPSARFELRHSGRSQSQKRTPHRREPRLRRAEERAR